jgi:hypothetical protein
MPLETGRWGLPEGRMLCLTVRADLPVIDTDTHVIRMRGAAEKSQ